MFTESKSETNQGNHIVFKFVNSTSQPKEEPFCSFYDYFSQIENIHKIPQKTIFKDCLWKPHKIRLCWRLQTEAGVIISATEEECVMKVLRNYFVQVINGNNLFG